MQREGNSTQYKPLSKKCILNSTNLKRLNNHNKLAENLEKKEDQLLKNRKGKYWSVKRRKATDTEQRSESSESTPSIKRENINERVDRLLASVHAKLEDDNIEMEEHKIEMVEDNIPGDEDMCANYYTHIRR
jgi:hypothetical protein